MPKTKIGEEVRRKLGLLPSSKETLPSEAAPLEEVDQLVEVELPKEELALSVLAKDGRYLGIEANEEGYAVVLLEKNGNVLTKTQKYKSSTRKALAMESFKLSTGRFIVDFNQRGLKNDKK